MGIKIKGLDLPVSFRVTPTMTQVPPTRSYWPKGPSSAASSHFGIQDLNM